MSRRTRPSGAEKGVYTLAADAALVGSPLPGRGAVVSVRRNTDGSFGPGQWVDLAYPGVDPTATLTSADSVAGGAVVGIVLGDSGFPFQADVQSSFQLSNVISSNAGNGIGLYGSARNQISMNYIGTDVTGTLPRPNIGNGLLLTAGASDNLIGGEATAGNDPTAGVFAVPPLGNLVSGNRQNGVLITSSSSRNQLSGNFIGTDASGNRALGNRLDGVAVVNADSNRLIGCSFQEDPFVFYNVISGNGANGVRVTNSNEVTIHANFMGVGANNATVVANGGNGLLVSGSSRNTQVGGVIPLGNVISGNAQNGIEVRDRVSGFVSFNTFAGLFAFGTAAPNQRDGILITSTGGNNLIRTCIVSGNLGDGIEIGGNATGVQVTETGVGVDTGLGAPLPNGGSGIKISGRAHGNSVGGFQPSVEPQNTISSNGRFGIEVVGQARNNSIYHSVIGVSGARNHAPLGNRLGGILLAPGTSSTTIGGEANFQSNFIASNTGNGLSLLSTRSNTISTNQITSNQGYGVFALGNCTGTTIRRNSVQSNSRGNVDLSNSRGIVFIP